MVQYVSKKSPQETLEREFAKINRRFFDDSIVAEPVLEVPPRPVVVSIENPSRKVEQGSAVEAEIEAGIQLAVSGNTEQAIKALTPLAERRYKPAVEALIHIERRRHGSYERWSRVFNAMDKPIERYPAACVDPDIAKIFIHPMIGSTHTPRYVMGYLLHHECLHLEIPPKDGSPHPPEFMERERAFPKRDQALSWLRKNEFPVVDF